MTGKRERYERSNMRGGMGVRKRLSEESLRDTYRLNGVRTGFAVARCYDKYGRWNLGYTIGIIVRKTASVVQVRWWDNQENIQTYDQGDARYEVDRGRWRILGLVQGNPLDPDNPLADALTKLRESARIESSANADTPPTEEMMMAGEKSHAAVEREAAKKALANGELKERDTYTAKQVATRCGTDSKTMRKFFRSSHSTVDPVGQGGRYEFDARDLPKIKQEFTAWQNKAKARKPFSKMEPQQIQKAAKDLVEENPEDEFTMEQVADAIERAQEQDLAQAVKDHFGDEDHEPTAEELEEMARLMNDVDLDDLDED